MSLDDLIERNRAFVHGRPGKPLPAAQAIPLAVVACYDPRLDDLLRPALGLGGGEGFMLRTAGAQVTPETLRSLATAVYLFQVERVLVVGHSSCRMAHFSTAEFIAAFRQRGVVREAFGAEDLRTWAGALASPREGVLAAVATIAGAPFLPADLELGGAVLNDASGELEVVHRPGERPSSAGTLGTAESESVGAEAPGQGPPQTAPVEAGAPPPPPRPELPETLAPAVETLTSVVKTLAADARSAGELRELYRAISAEKHLLRKLALVQSVVGQLVGETRETAAAFKLLKGQAATARPELATVLRTALDHILGQGGVR